MARTHTPAWLGLTFVVGDDVHLLPLYEDDRIHDIRNQDDCFCKPDKETRFGERPFETPYNVFTHKPTRYPEQ